MVDVSAVLERVRALGAIGRTADGGVSRLAYSPEDREARALLVRWMDELGLRVREDAAGNIFGRRGSADRPALLIGSHIDSVPNGGVWDGCLGVCTALETAAALPPLPVPLEVVSWQMEESSRFGQATFGSRVFSGRIDPLAAAAWRDRDGLGLVTNLGEGAGDDGHADRSHQPARLELVAHCPDRLRGWPDEDDPGIPAGLAEIRILGEEAVARMNGVGAGAAGRNGLFRCDTAVVLGHRGPIDHVPPGFHVFRPAILMFQIIGVLPQIQT